MEMTVESPVVAYEDRPQTAQRIAADLFNRQPDWISFFREVLGVDGLLRKLFPTAEEFADFERTEHYTEIQGMLAKLRERTGSQADGKEPTRVITVRLPKSLHESLRAEAHGRKTSMNQLCISKLLQVIDAELAVVE
jgi:predicted HicB family RNase H-like nuclease